ncbi:hypothetical protein [Dyadobacter sp.]|uniref:hypothetical protein n=1 Tax=Dyadobacter sp. TaxID=1914288 RepID=UPI0025BA8152|nr:hypothetical protein [Dyadobacter sp.]
MKKAMYFACLLTLGCSPMRVLLPRTDSKSFKSIDFCELPKHKGDLVCVKGRYSGVEEYWSFKTTSVNGCPDKLDVELNLQEMKYAKLGFDRKSNRVHNNYMNSYLLIEVIGTYSDQEKEYGHLGHNNSVFVVQEIVSVTVKRSKTF